MIAEFLRVILTFSPTRHLDHPAACKLHVTRQLFTCGPRHNIYNPYFIKLILVRIKSIQELYCSFMHFHEEINCLRFFINDCGS